MAETEDRHPVFLPVFYATMIILCVCRTGVIGAPLDESKTPADQPRQPDVDLRAGAATRISNPIQTGKHESRDRTSLRHSGGSRPRGSGPKVKMACNMVPVSTLHRWMGPAFNARYMSVGRPTSGDSRARGGHAPAGDGRLADQPTGANNSRHSAFRVGRHFVRSLDERPRPTFAAEVDLPDDRYGRVVDADTGLLRFLARVRRAARVTSSAKIPRKRARLGVAPSWKCSSELVWRDLGDDHFPRYLRTVVCTQARCYFQAYRCRERSFTVKVLKRVSDECVPVYGANATRMVDGRRQPGAGVLPLRYEQDWVFEERAVPFCCDCVATARNRMSRGRTTSLPTNR